MISDDCSGYCQSNISHLFFCVDLVIECNWNKFVMCLNAYIRELHGDWVTVFITVVNAVVLQ